MLLGKIDTLNNDFRGCFSSDQYLASMLGKSIQTIQKRLLALENRNLIERSTVDGKRSIVVTLLKSEHCTTHIRALPLLKSEHYNKEITKEIKKRESALASSFLNQKYSKRFDAWEKKYQHQIGDYDKFIDDYNDTIQIKEIPFKVDDLFDFLCRYAKGWIKNDARFAS